MVSKPNFVLGIKQTSLASKENSHVHITIRSHTYLSAGSRLHGISQPPWLCAVSKSNNQVIRVSSYQICAHQVFAWWNQQDKRAPRHIATKTQEPNLQRQSHAPPHAKNGSWNSHTRHRRFSTPNSDLSHMCRQDGLVVSRSTWLENLIIIRRHTRLHSLLRYLPRHHTLVHVVTRRKTDADVIRWHHHSTSVGHARPKPRQRHIIGWRQRLAAWSVTRPGNLDHVSVDLWLFALTFDQKSKLPKGPILLIFSHRFQFRIPFLHLKLWNWSIDTFFIVVSSKTFFKAFPSDLLMLIQPQAFIKLPPWVWEKV